MNQGSELCGKTEEEYSRKRGSTCKGSKGEVGVGSSRQRGREGGVAGVKRDG